jgi:hypothetical protein
MDLGAAALSVAAFVHPAREGQPTPLEEKCS